MWLSQGLLLELSKTKDYLSQVVKWKPTEQYVGKEFNHTENSEYDPIHKPLCIIILVSRLNCFDAKNTNAKQTSSQKSNLTGIQQDFRRASTVTIIMKEL